MGKQRFTLLIHLHVRTRIVLTLEIWVNGFLNLYLVIFTSRKHHSYSSAMWKVILTYPSNNYCYVSLILMKTAHCVLNPSINCAVP